MGGLEMTMTNKNTAEEIETLLNTVDLLTQATIEERKAFQDKVAAAIMKDTRDQDEISKLNMFFDLFNERFPAPKH